MNARNDEDDGARFALGSLAQQLRYAATGARRGILTLSREGGDPYVVASETAYAMLADAIDAHLKPPVNGLRDDLLDAPERVHVVPLDRRDRVLDRRDRDLLAVLLRDRLTTVEPQP